MSSIARPTPPQRVRRYVVLASAVFAVLVAQLQILSGWGQTPSEFSADSDATLKVAGYAFAIWGLIYVGLLAYAVRQALPQTGEGEFHEGLSWPAAAAFIGIGLWVVAAAIDQEAGTIVLIFGSAIILILALLGMAPRLRALPRFDRDRMFVLWPLSLLAGWLTIASPLNLITVLTGNGQLPPGLPPTGWAIVAIVIVGAIAVAMSWRLGTLAFAIPVAWGLIGAFVAEQERNPTLGFTALGVGLAVLVLAALTVVQLRPSVERVPRR